MVRNKLAMAVLALSVLQANVAGALGLGNLSVKSALNQPLSAEIKLLDIGDLDAAQIKIQLGSPEDFQRAAVERDYFLTNLKFNVDIDGHGGGVVRISTRESVVEPYLNFVIEARWPNGRVLREFAVLLDPPTFSANRAAAAIAPAKSGASAAPRPARAAEAPVAASEAVPAPAPADVALPAAEKGGEYRIQVYDTLSKIAARHRPAADVSVEQTMLAIQRANPQVFIRNNVNLIKSGYVIRLPSADEARAIDAAQAAGEVEEQVRQWRGGAARSSAPAATGPQLDARAPEPTTREGGYKEQARLSIAAPGASDKSAAGEGGGGSGKGVEALRNQLTASQESLEKGRRDNQELQSRLDDMERQIATLQRLITLKDDQLAALQAKAAQPAAAAATPAATTPAATTPAATTPAATTPAATTPAATAPATSTTSETTTTTTTTTTAETPAAAPVAVPAPAAAPKAPAAKPLPAPAPELTLLDQLTANPLYIGGAGVLVALLAALAVQRRRKAAAEESEALSDFTLDDHVDFGVDDDSAQHARIDDAATAVLVDTSDRREEPRVVQPQTVRSETGDAIAESDIYIAYGRYQQAVDLLSHAIDAEPARSDLRVKLLEVCLEMRNREAFRQQFVALQGLGDADAVAHAKDLLSSVDGVSDWLVDLPQAQRPVNELVASAAVAAAAATAAITAADIVEHQHQEDLDAPFATAAAPAFDAGADADAGLDLDLDDLQLGDELGQEETLAPEEQLRLEGEAAERRLDEELADFNLDDDLNLEGELDLDAPLDLEGGLDFDKELDLDRELSLDREVDLDKALEAKAAPGVDAAQELAEALDLESHPGLDSDFDLDDDTSVADLQPTALEGGLDTFAAGLSLPADKIADDDAAKLDFDFEIEDVEDDLAATPAGGTSFDLDSTSIELAGSPSPVAAPDETVGLESGLALELEHDDLGRTLETLGETGYLNDLEGVAEALDDLEQPAATPAAAFDLDTDFAADTGALDGDLSAEFDLGNLDADLPEIDRLDLAAGQSDALDAGAAPASGAIDELPDLADELPPEFDVAAAESDAAASDAEGDEFDFLTDADEIATKLDLARAYIDMGDTEGAKDILDEVLQEGTDTQRQEASTLLDRIA